MNSTHSQATEHTHIHTFAIQFSLNKWMRSKKKTIDANKWMQKKWVKKSDCIFLWPLAMPMQLNLPFDRALQKTISANFQQMLFTEHEIHVAHGFWLLYTATTTASYCPLAPIYRYWKIQYTLCSSLFASSPSSLFVCSHISYLHAVTTISYKTYYSIDVHINETTLWIANVPQPYQKSIEKKVNRKVSKLHVCVHWV